MPVSFHNLRGYDGKFTINQAHQILGELGNPKIDVIHSSYEKFMSCSIGSLKFTDVFQFMASSLDDLVKKVVRGK